jgi:hypothetical protein
MTSFRLGKIDGDGVGGFGGASDTFVLFPFPAIIFWLPTLIMMDSAGKSRPLDCRRLNC